LRSHLKSKLHDFIKQFDIDLLIAENVLTIPLHVPLGLALTETVAETQLPTIAHHHDFYWERVRFSVNAVSDYIRMAFPPNLGNIRHVVINSAAQHYSYFVLRNQLSAIINSFFGGEVKKFAARARPKKSKAYLSVNSNQIMYTHYNSQNCAPVK
jgi:hypothetical protein